MAGLSAARRLREQGVQVQILEGRFQVGGRMRTDHSLGVPVDLGASWIHGIQGNPLTELTEQHHVRTQRTFYDDLVLYRPDGTSWPQTDWAYLRAWFLDFLAPRNHSDAESTLAEAFARARATREFTPAQEQILNWLQGRLEVSIGANFETLSWQHWNQDLELDGGDKLLLDGYQTLARRLADGLDIHFGRKILRIEQDERGVRVLTQRVTGPGLAGAGEAALSEPGLLETYDADAAVITLPLGILQAGRVQFAPEWPEWKQGALRRIGMGLLNKVVLRFPSQFWPAEPHILGYASPDRGEFPGFLNLTPYHQEPVLVAFSGGRFARALEELSDAQILERTLSVLRRMFGRIPAPTGHVITRWAHDPWTLGSYSHLPLGATGHDYDLLAEPVGRWFFAGEATFRKHPSTVHGARLSGLREADRLAALPQLFR